MKVDPEKVAAEIRNIWVRRTIQDDGLAIDMFVYNVARLFERVNPSFDKAKFIKDCRLTI